MFLQHHPIYVSEEADAFAVNEIPLSFDGPFCCCPPDFLSGVDVCQSSLVILDGTSLGAESIAIARRLRWQGFAGEILLSAGIVCALDRAIARESGVSDFLCPPPGGGARSNRQNQSQSRVELQDYHFKLIEKSACATDNFQSTPRRSEEACL